MDPSDDDDEVMMMDIDMGPSIDPDSKDGRGDEEDYNFKVLTTQQVLKNMKNCIDEVNAVVQLPRTTVRLLLNRFDWRKDELLEKFYDGETEKLFSEAGVVSSTVSVSEAASCGYGGNEDCEICYVEWPCSSMYGMGCGHRFCLQCWLTYLTSRIMDKGQGQFISCPGHKCPLLVADDKVMEIVTEPNVKSKYHQLITNSYVKQDPLVRWCPSPDCNHAIQVEFVKWKPVTCTCGHTFCFQCGNDWHDPVQCKWLVKWQTNSGTMSDDLTNLQLLNANVKKCPKCSFLMEKTGGCNHVVCGNPDCRLEFCWLCLGPSKTHGMLHFQCNRYDAKDTMEKRQALLKRYEHYGARYLNHKKSLGLEMKLSDSIMPLVEQHGLPSTETYFLKKALDVLCQCRHTLSYSYIFAFFLEKNNQTIMFEDNQRDLEEATETLSGYLERELTSKNLADMRLEVQDKYRYCESRRKVLVDHVHEGYEQGWWVYDVIWTNESTRSEAVVGREVYLRRAECLHPTADVTLPDTRRDFFRLPTCLLSIAECLLPIADVTSRHETM